MKINYLKLEAKDKVKIPATDAVFWTLFFPFKRCLEEALKGVDFISTALVEEGRPQSRNNSPQDFLKPAKSEYCTVLLDNFTSISNQQNYELSKVIIALFKTFRQRYFLINQ